MILQANSVTTFEKVGDFKLEKTGAAEFGILPSLYEDNPMETATGKIDFNASLGLKKGQLDGEITIENGISFLDRVKDWLVHNWVKALSLLAAVILFCGYAFKRKLPKKLESRPLIEGSPQRPGIKKTTAHGTIHKNMSTYILPFVSQRAKIKFCTTPSRTLEVKAAGHGSMWINNYTKFAGKNEYTFKGQMIEKEEGKKIKKPHINAGDVITYKTKDYLYSCYLNRKN